MSVADRIEKIELEDNRKGSEYIENMKLQKNKLKYSHPYEKYFLQYIYGEILQLIISNSYRKLVFLGAGAGNEAAYIRSKLPFDNHITLTDLSYYSLKHYKECFKHYHAPLPERVLTCSFNKLPFSKQQNDSCAIAFLCLHHTDFIGRVISHILEIFDNLILFEPMTNDFLKLLAKWGIAQRAESVDYRPARVNLCFFENMKDKFNVEIKTYIQVPRDYLPFISHRQRVIFLEENMKFERLWSSLLFKCQLFLNCFFSKVHFGNMTLVHIARRTR